MIVAFDIITTHHTEDFMGIKIIRKGEKVRQSLVSQCDCGVEYPSSVLVSTGLARFHAHTTRVDYNKVRIGFSDNGTTHRSDMALAAVRLQKNIVELTHILSEYFAHFQNEPGYVPSVCYDPGCCCSRG